MAENLACPLYLTWANRACGGCQDQQAPRAIRKLNMRGIWLSLTVFGLWVAGGALVGTQVAVAQEQFFTQSGGRGLQNAKTNARLTKTETDIGLIQEDLKTIQPHARAQLGNCGNTGEKLRYDGRNWICEKETDPTVKSFAKKDLPTCTGGSILGVSAGDLSCVTSSFVSNETDPTVQPYAKTPLPSCGSEQMLSVQSGALVCQSDQKGLTLEIDPKVHNFARKDVVSVLPNCGGNQVLTMTGGMLSCQVDSVGLTIETDPLIQPFARTDNGEPALAACNTGEVLTAATINGKTLLSCVTSAAVGAIALDDLIDVTAASPTSGTVLTYSAGAWRALPSGGGTLALLSDVQLTGPVTDQLLRFNGTRWVNTDDRVATMTNTNWCHVVGGRIVCDRPSPLTCGAGEALNWNSGTSTWVCSNVATAVSASIALNGLTDVTITTPGIGQALVYDGAGWSNSALSRVLVGDSQVVVTDSGIDGLISFATEGQTRMAINNAGRIGVGVMPSAPFMMDISGSTRVAGNLTVNGISATGNISANRFVGDGSLLTNLNLSSIQAAGVAGSVQFKGASNEISGTNTLLVSSGASRADLTVSGTVKVAGDGAEACSGVSQYGQMRFVQDAGRMVMQICRP